MVGLKSGVKLRPMHLRAQLHQRVLELREGGLRYDQIIGRVEGEFGIRISKSHVSGWIRGSHHPCGSVRALDTTPRPELTYVICVMMGDTSMSISHYNYMIKLRVTDKEFAEEFARCLSVILGRGAPRVRWHEKTHAWHTELSSLLLREFLLQPPSRLAQTIQHCDSCKGAFLRGFFDSEGSIRQRDLNISNCNLELIQYVRALLLSLGIQSTPIRISQKSARPVVIKGKFYRQNKDIYKLHVRATSLEAYRDRVGFTIHRKANALDLSVESTLPLKYAKLTELLRQVGVGVEPTYMR